MARSRLTFSDALEHLAGYIGGTPDTRELPSLKQAVISALDRICEDHDWSTYKTLWRQKTSAVYDTGTITYDHTGGTYENELTLASGTWPTDAVYGHVKIGNNICYVSRRIDGTTLVLDPVLNPGEDVAAGTSYTWIRSLYTLPEDFISMESPMGEAATWFGRQVTPGDWASMYRYAEPQGTSRVFAIMGDPSLPGRMAIGFFPALSDSETIDLLYLRRPRKLRYGGSETAAITGTVSITSGSSTITGSSTSFASNMAGDVLRISADAVTAPTGIQGANPYAEEMTLKTFSSTTSFTAYENATQSLSGKKFSISSPVDVEVSMERAFLRCAEWQAHIIRRMEGEDQAFGRYLSELKRAKATDNRSWQTRSAAPGTGYYTEMSDFSAPYTES